MVHDAQMSTTYDKNDVDVTMVHWALSKRDVHCIVVGGVAVVLQGGDKKHYP